MHSPVAPLTVLALVLLRAFELRMRRSPTAGAVHFPISLLMLLLSGFAVIAIAFVEWYVRPGAFSLRWYSLGLILILCGFWLRAASAAALGEFWSKQIEIRPKHQVVRSGPYAYVRHPIYVSLILELLGGCVVLKAPLAVAACLVLYVPVLIWRTVLEEQAMRTYLGQAYVEYAAAVPAIIPFTKFRGK